MKKTVYVNGLVVGEVEGTGDVQKDIETTREFLKAKGLYRETTVVQSMFCQALSFCTAAAYLYERDLKTTPVRNGASMVPFVVNSALSIELYLKALHRLADKSLRGHHLLDLYDSLPNETRNTIVEAAQREGPGYQVVVTSAEHFREFVAELDTAFVDWRYCYETGETGKVTVQPAILVMKALHESCRRLGAT
jgi:hypothetical protein